MSMFFFQLHHPIVYQGNHVCRKLKFTIPADLAHAKRLTGSAGVAIEERPVVPARLIRSCEHGQAGELV